MSIESMAICLHHSKARGTDKLILVGIANHDGDGGAWPSVETLARYGNVTKRAVQQSINKLVELKELRVINQGGGNAGLRNDRRPNLYQILVSCPVDCDRTKNHRTTARGEADFTPSDARDEADFTPWSNGVKHSAQRGEAQRTNGVKHTSPEPSLNSSETVLSSTRASVEALSTAWAQEEKDSSMRKDTNTTGLVEDLVAYARVKNPKWSATRCRQLINTELRDNHLPVDIVAKAWRACVDDPETTSPDRFPHRRHWWGDRPTFAAAEPAGPVCTLPGHSKHQADGPACQNMTRLHALASDV